MCVCWALTELGVIEREVPQVGRVLRQGEEAPRKAVPHEVTPGALPHHPVLDDLGEGQEEERGGHSGAIRRTSDSSEEGKNFCMAGLVPIPPLPMQKDNIITVSAGFTESSVGNIIFQNHFVRPVGRRVFLINPPVTIL